MTRRFTSKAIAAALGTLGALVADVIGIAVAVIVSVFLARWMTGACAEDDR